MRTIYRFGLISAICLIFALPAWADNEIEKANTLPTFTLGDIVVTAEADAPQVAITDVFTEDDIAATHALTLGEALAYIPGITVTTARKNEPRIYMNGFNLKRILVLIDGVPYYETNSGNLNLNQIPTAVISRIEVVKGAASALYGPNAMGGVIKVYTKKGGAEPFVSAYAEAGKYDTYNLGVAAAGSYNKLNAWISVDHRTSNGWDVSGNYDSKSGELRRSGGGGGGGGGGSANKYYANFQDDGKRENSDLDTTSVWTRFGVDLNQHSEYYASFHYITTEGGIPHNVESNNINYNANGGQSTHFNRWKVKEEIGLDLSGQQQLFDGFTLLGKLFYHYHYDEQEQYYPVYRGISANKPGGSFGGGGGGIGWPGGNNGTADDSIDFYGDLGATQKNKDDMYGGQVIADWQINDMHVLRGAVQYRWNNHKEKVDKWAPWADYASQIGSVGLEYQLNLLSNRLVITPGFSYDWYKLTDAKSPNFSGQNVSGWSHPNRGGTKDSFNPMIGVNYLLFDNTTLYGSIAQKTRFPTLNEMANSGQSNHKLDPEESINYTLGISQNFFNERLNLSLAGFYNDISDWISSANRDKIFYNEEDVNVYGFQVNGQFKLTDDITLFGAYVYNEARNRSNPRVTNKVTGVIKHKVDLGASFYMPDIAARFDIRGTYVGDWYKDLPTVQDPTIEASKVSGYFTADVKFTKYLFDDHLQIYGVVKNILIKIMSWDRVFPDMAVHS